MKVREGRLAAAARRSNYAMALMTNDARSGAFRAKLKVTRTGKCQ